MERQTSPFKRSWNGLSARPTRRAETPTQLFHRQYKFAQSVTPPEELDEFYDYVLGSVELIDPLALGRLNRWIATRTHRKKVFASLFYVSPPPST
jgi:hypothetical protein